MTSTYVRVLFWLAVMVAFLNSGETCTIGTTAPDLNVCNQYNLCVKSGTTGVYVLQKCATGKNFDPSRGYCTSDYNCLVCD